MARGYADGEEVNVKFYKILVIIHDLSRLLVNHAMSLPGGNCHGASSTLHSLTYLDVKSTTESLLVLE